MHNGGNVSKVEQKEGGAVVHHSQFESFAHLSNAVWKIKAATRLIATTAPLPSCICFLPEKVLHEAHTKSGTLERNYVTKPKFVVGLLNYPLTT